MRSGLIKLVVASMTTLILVVSMLSAGLLNGLLSKFKKAQQKEDLSQGRCSGWAEELRYWTWFGRGTDYVTESGLEGVVTGHSTWISHISQYGLINMLLLLVFLGAAARWAWRAARLRVHRLAVVLLAVVVGFVVNATFETGTSTPGIWLAVILFAICLQGLNGATRSVTIARWDRA